MLNSSETVLLQQGLDIRFFFESVTRQTHTASVTIANMTTEAAKVFAVPELFEMVLLKLPLRDLLLAQRVNKSFQGAIQSSTRIQERLFFKRSSTKRTDGRVAINPFLSRVIELDARKTTLSAVSENYAYTDIWEYEPVRSANLQAAGEEDISIEQGQRLLIRKNFGNLRPCSCVQHLWRRYCIFLEANVGCRSAMRIYDARHQERGLSMD